MILSLALAVPFLVYGAISPQSLQAVSQATVDWLTARFDWFYLLAIFGFLVFCAYLAISRHGEVRLGKADERPEFSTVSWLAMLFSAGMGSGLLFWGMAEPVSHYLKPPGLAGGTPEAAGKAFEITFFHWGIHAWAVYGVVALALAWSQFRHGRPALISSAFYPLLKERVHGPIGVAIDTLAVLATFFGVAATLGMSTLQVNSGLHQLVGMPVNAGMQMAIIAFFTVLYLLSATTGLQKGIRLLSNTNMVLAVVLLAVITVIGPTAEIFRAFTDGMGRYFQDFFKLSLGQFPFSDRSWLHSWTLVYWPWWIAWAPFVGTFIARISRGRTIREFVAAVLLVPSIFSFFWFAAFGTTGIGLVRGGLDLASAIQADVSSALFVAFAHMPLGLLLSALAMGLMSVFFVTSADSAVYVLSMLTSRGQLHPPMWMRIMWGLVQSGIGATLLLMGGIQAVQIVTIIAAFPFTILMVGLCAALWKGLLLDEAQPVETAATPHAQEAA